jgi:transcriptional regulator with XRE-family HTH domain
MPTGKELRKALKINDLTMEQAADMLEMARGTLYNYINKGELDEDFVQTVQTKLNIDLNNIPEPKPFLEQLRDYKNADEPYLVPFIDIPAQAGYSKAYQQRDYIATLKKYPILPNVDPTGAVWRYFQIDGDSMEPAFKSGDVILASLVTKEDWNQFTDFNTYVVVTHENLWIKDVYKESPEEWILLSRNENCVTCDPFPVKVKDVLQLWVMRRHVRNRAEKHKLYDINEIRKKIKR